MEGVNINRELYHCISNLTSDFQRDVHVEYHHNITIIQEGFVNFLSIRIMMTDKDIKKELYNNL
jgi:hypothetical protein